MILNISAQDPDHMLCLTAQYACQESLDFLNLATDVHHISSAWVLIVPVQARLLAEKVGAPLYMASDIDPSEQEIEALKVPAAAGSYPFPAVELIENGGISPYIWRDGRYGIGLLMRGEDIITSRAFHTPMPLS